MGRYADTVKKQFDEIQLGMKEPVPDYLRDSSLIPGYVRRQNGLAFRNGELGRMVLEDIRSLSDEQQRQIYNEFTTDEYKERFTFDAFKTRMSGNALMNTSTVMKADVSVIAERVEQMLPRERIDEASARIENIKTPDDPDFPLERKVYSPYAEDLKALEDGVAPGDPDAERKRALIKSSGEILMYVRNDYLEFLNKNDKTTGNKSGGFTLYTSNIQDNDTEDFFRNYEGGKLLDKLPRTKTDRLSGTRIDMLDMGPEGSGTLSEEEVDEFRNIKPAYSSEFKDKAERFVELMDEIGVDNYKNSESMDVQGGKTVFKSEQGKKMYGFWPLATTKRKLAEAVKNGDYNEMERLCNEYKRIEDLTDKQMEIAKSVTGGFIGQNVNSTRPEFNWKNPIPLKYAEDYVGHNRVNGMYQLYALSKNTGKSVREILDDPTKVSTEIAQDYITKNSFDNHKTVGAKLFWARSDSSEAGMGWMQQLGLLERGLTGAAGLAESEQERKQVMGAVAVASGSANQIVNSEIAAWKQMNSPADEKTDALYGQAVLLPDDECDIRKIGMTLLKPDWREQLSSSATVERLRREGKLDYGAMAERTERILNEVREEKKASKNRPSNFSETEYKLAASKAMVAALRTATDEEKQTEDYNKLKNMAIDYHNEAMKQKLAFYVSGSDRLFPDYDSSEFPENPDEYDADPISDLERGLRVQMAEKKGAFLSSTNSPEHQKMVRAQQFLYLKLKFLRGDPFPQNISPRMQEMIKNADFETCANDARKATFEYCCKKTDNGKSQSFVHAVGTNRHESAWGTLNSIDKLIANTELASPAEVKRRSIRKELYMHMDDENWLRRNIENKAAGILYASTLIHKKRSANSMNHDLESTTMKDGVESIRNTPAFRKLIQSHSPKELAGLCISGKGSLANAYIKAAGEVSPNRRNAQKPEDMTVEQKQEFMKQNVLPVLQ